MSKKDKSLKAKAVAENLKINAKNLEQSLTNLENSFAKLSGSFRNLHTVMEKSFTEIGANLVRSLSESEITSDLKINKIYEINEDGEEIELIFVDAKEGDNVWSAIHGSGEIIEVNEDMIKPLYIAFDNGNKDYTFCGRSEPEDALVTLYHSKPTIIKNDIRTNIFEKSNEKA